MYVAVFSCELPLNRLLYFLTVEHKNGRIGAPRLNRISMLCRQTPARK